MEFRRSKFKKKTIFFQGNGDAVNTVKELVSLTESTNEIRLKKYYFSQLSVKMRKFHRIF